MNEFRIAPHHFPAHVSAILNVLSAEGYTAFVVGGCVRDLLLGRIPHDYDVTTNAVPEVVQRLFQRTVATGLKHGTVTVLDFGEPVEVTTFRVEASYSDGRRPDAVRFAARIEDDLLRRDFTMNAMAMDLTGNIVDPYGGWEDIHYEVIRAVGIPEERFYEDALRIVRAIRFCAQFNFTIEAETRRAMETHASRLVNVSAERIGQEFVRVAEGDWWAISALLAHGEVLMHLPEPWPAFQRGFQVLSHDKAREERWKTVLRTSMRWDHEKRSMPWDKEKGSMLSVCAWALASDLPPEYVLMLCSRMAWPTAWGKWAESVLKLARQTPKNWLCKEWRTNLYENGAEVCYASCLLHWWWDGDPASFTDVEQVMEEYRCTQPLWTLQDLAIRGNHLQAMGFHGPDIGRALQEVKNAVLLGQIENKHEVLSAWLSEWARKNGVMQGDSFGE